MKVEVIGRREGGPWAGGLQVDLLSIKASLMGG